MRRDVKGRALSAPDLSLWGGCYKVPDCLGTACQAAVPAPLGFQGHPGARARVREPPQLYPEVTLSAPAKGVGPRIQGYWLRTREGSREVGPATD